MNRFTTALFLSAIVAFSQSAPAQTWANEPAGSSVLADWDGSSVTGGGWSCYCSDVTIVSDATAPTSPSSVAQWRYSTGFTGGISPGSLSHALPRIPEVYVGFTWKPSSPWDAHSSGVNKLGFLISQGYGQFVPEMFGQDGGPFYPKMVLETPTDNHHLGNGYGDTPGTWMLGGNKSNPAITLGQWHRFEIYSKLSTTPTSQDGVLRWWFDGQLVGDYNTVNTPTQPWTQFAINPTWGGTGGTKQQTDYYWYDHARISLPPGAVKPLAITTAQLTAASVGKSYVASLAGTGGLAPYTWALESGTLPAGLTLFSGTGFLSGTPSQGGLFNLAFKVTDSRQPPVSATKTLALAVSGGSAIGGQWDSPGNVEALRVIPSMGKLSFVGNALPKSRTSITLYNAHGKVVWQHSSAGLPAEWNHKGSLEKGIYIMRLQQGNAQSTLHRFCLLR